MNRRKLFRTIENLTPDNYASTDELFQSVIEEILKNEEINITGARVWQFDDRSYSYQLSKQIGNIERIENGFRLFVDEYPLFNEISEQRSVMGIETNPRLRAIGIKNYAATGVGEKISLNGRQFYPYILAFNSEKLDEDLLDTLNIISSAISSFMRSKRFEQESEVIHLELARAREIQNAILPQHQYKFGNYEIYGTTIPERHVCGDFFDYIEIGEDARHLGVVVGDAAGKGMSAAVQALYISGALRLGAAHQIKPSAYIRTINKMITRTFPDERFATLFYAELFDNKSGSCLYVNAGHNSPIYYNFKTEEIRYLESTGGVLGLSPEQQYSSENINLREGDLLVCYSDGITEAANADSEFYGEARLEKLILSQAHNNPREIVQAVIEEVMQFSSHGTYQDDKTLVVVKRVK